MQWLKVQSPKFHICIAIWSHLQRPAYTKPVYTNSLQGADHHNSQVAMFIYGETSKKQQQRYFKMSVLNKDITEIIKNGKTAKNDGRNGFNWLCLVLKDASHYEKYWENNLIFVWFFISFWGE